MKNWLKHGFSLVIFLGVALAGFKYLDLDLMLQAWRKFSWKALGALWLFPAIYLWVKAWRFQLLMSSADPELRPGTILRGYAASQSASLLPAGFAARSAILAQAGVPMERSMGPVLANSALDQFALLIGGLFVGIWYQQVRPAALTLTGILIVLVALFVWEPSREAIGRWVQQVGERFGQGDKVKEFQQACWSLLDAKLFLSTFALTVVADLMSYAILVVVVAAMGLQVKFGALAAAFLIPTLLGRMSPLPAGAGVTEAGMVAIMAKGAGMTLDQAAAATTLMRAIDVVLPALYGALVYLGCWRGHLRTASEASA